MKSLIFLLLVVIGVIAISMVCGGPVEPIEPEMSTSFGFKQANGYQRVEEVKYNKASNFSNDGKPDIASEKPVEFKGGYSYISADGYEYTVKYKANKNGFQPYVTAHKLNTEK